MDERTRRIGKNEALFRQVNEEVEHLNRGVVATASNTFPIVCECGDLLCQERINVSVNAYETVRADPTLFLVVPGHEIPTAEDVVETTEGYNIVKKNAGEPRRLAEETDPRTA